MKSNRSKQEPLDLDSVDPGIRDVVSKLRSLGFFTIDSGDGHSKPPEWDPEPVAHVYCEVRSSVNLPNEAALETHRLAKIAKDEGWNAAVQLTWSPGQPWIISLHFDGPRGVL